MTWHDDNAQLENAMNIYNDGWIHLSSRDDYEAESFSVTVKDGPYESKIPAGTVTILHLHFLHLLLKVKRRSIEFKHVSFDSKANLRDLPDVIRYFGTVLYE